MGANRFALGERVRFTGTAVKKHDGEKTIFVDGPLPMKSGNVSQPTAINEGMIVGRKTIYDFDLHYDYDEYGMSYGPPTASQIFGTFRRGWVIAFDLGRKPVLCFNYQVESIEGKNNE